MNPMMGHWMATTYCVNNMECYYFHTITRQWDTGRLNNLSKTTSDSYVTKSHIQLSIFTVLNKNFHKQLNTSFLKHIFLLVSVIPPTSDCPIFPVASPSLCPLVGSITLFDLLILEFYGDLSGTWLLCISTFLLWAISSETRSLYAIQMLIT